MGVANIFRGVFQISKVARKVAKMVRKRLLGGITKVAKKNAVIGVAKNFRGVVKSTEVANCSGIVFRGVAKVTYSITNVIGERLLRGVTEVTKQLLLRGVTKKKAVVCVAKYIRGGVGFIKVD
ncbi:hypothetical protein KQX54_020646 [Cotesia glomerata]|uniref:Uncharacterized protein n=1 Tax=Cotesia glomerata TaxID=32391 RepID=A0AAV7I590_COTGL|nr:hypothetical protein KQX54_020646 [Cotesia glomerata]